jgi:hypothetical protein
MIVRRFSRGEVDVANILYELGVFARPDDELDLHATFREDLGLDSQELVTLAEVVSSLSVGSAPVVEERLIVVADAVTRLDSCRDPWLPADPSFVLQGATIVAEPVETTFAAIADYARWPQILKHVTRIEPDRDIGQFQSFRMYLEEPMTGERSSVRSWRYVNAVERIIDFAQPDPPVGFRMHCGGWPFRRIDRGHTELISFHAFEVLPDHEPDEAVSLIRKHIHAALSTWSAQGEQP